MKFSAALALAPLAAAVPHVARDANTPFGVIALHSGSPIHFLSLNAAGGKFWLGGKTKTYCPDNVGVPCNKLTNDTILSSAVSLDVSVPGGQSIYVDKYGAVSFTPAHSSSLPGGASNGPFIYTPDSLGDGKGEWSYSTTGFMACPVPGVKAHSGASARLARHVAPAGSLYQVFANSPNSTVPGGKVGDCLGFDALAAPVNGTAGAWQYI